MNHQSEKQLFQDEAGSRPSLLLPAAGTLAVLAYCLFVFRYTGAITDTSWLLTLLDRMHGGDRLYRDIIETNPPFSIWLYIPPYFAAKTLGVGPEIAVQIYTFLICVLGVGATCWLLRVAGLSNKRKSRILFPVLLAFSVIFAGSSFTERDQIGAVLSVPLFVLAFWRSDLAIKPRPKARHWLLAGVLGGILPLAKPHYAVVYVALALWLAYKRRDVRMVFLPEFLLPASILAIYLFTAYQVYPEYFGVILPLLNETYLDFRQPFWILFLCAVPTILLCAIATLPKHGKRMQALKKMFIIVSVTALLPFFFQGKGWPYHQYLAILLATLSILLPILLDDNGTVRHTSDRQPLYKLIAACLAIVLAHLQLYSIEIPPKNFVQEIRRETHDPTVAMLGGDIAASFPLTRMIAGKWIEPYCSDWLIVFAKRLEQRAEAAHNENLREYYASLADRYAIDKLDRLERKPPDLLLVDHGTYSSQVAAYFLKRPGYAAFMGSYRKLADSDRMAAYLRVEDH